MDLSLTEEQELLQTSARDFLTQNSPTGQKSLRFYVTLTVVSYAVGLAFRIWMVEVRWNAEFSPILWGWPSFYEVGRLSMTLGHIGLFFIVWHWASNTRLMRALTAAGRMALTNYIGQTIIANLIFTGIGLGLYGTLERKSIVILMLGVWVFQLLFSVW